MNPLDLIFSKGFAILAVCGYIGFTTAWLDHDEQKLGAATATCNTLRTQDAKDANDAVASLLKAQQAKDAAAAEDIRQSQARADQAHEKTMLVIQRRQDTANQHFEDASHDKAAIAWALQPVPADYALGMCDALGNCPGSGGGATAGAYAQSRPQGSGADGGDAASTDAHRQPAGDHQASGSGPGHLQRR